MFYKKILIASFLLLFVSGCGGSHTPSQDIATVSLLSAGSSLNKLKNALDPNNTTLPNALIVHKYSAWISKNKPDFADVAKLINMEAGPQSAAIKSKEDELKAMSLRYNSTSLKSEPLERSVIAKTLRIRAFASDYNNILLDSVNVLAGLSGGKLAKFDQPSKDSSVSNVPASEYIGNPSYGSWKQSNNGTSFWEWYGMYSMFNNVFSTPVYRSRWYGSHGGYSYFDRYGSSYERSSWRSGYNGYYKDSGYLKSHPSAFNNVKSRGRIKNPAFVSSKKATSFSKGRQTSFKSRASKISKTSRQSVSRNTSSFRSSSRSGGSGGRGGK